MTIATAVLGGLLAGFTAPAFADDAVPPAPTDVLTLDTDSLDFGTVISGSTGYRTVLLTNDGSTSVSLLGVSVHPTYDASPTYFEGSWGTPCFTLLTPHSSCFVEFRLVARSAGGPVDASATISTSVGDLTVHLHGETDAAMHHLSVVPSVVDFGDVPVGGHAERQITITNTGNVPWPNAVANSVTVFTIDRGDCPIDLPVGASCVWTVAFDPYPGLPQGYTLNRQIGSDAWGDGAFVLTGRSVEAAPPAPKDDPATPKPDPTLPADDGDGTPPANDPDPTPSAGTPHLVLAADTLDFGDLAANGEVTTRTVTLTNDGDGDATLTGIDIAQAYPTNYTGGWNGCDPVLSPGTSCDLTFSIAKPPYIQAFTADATIRTTAGDLVVHLAARGVLGILSATAADVDFGTVRIGQTATGVATVTNTGNLPYPISYFSSTNTTDFTIDGTACPATLAVGASCQVALSFIPSAEASYGAYVTFGAPAYGVASFTVSGTGVLGIAELSASTESIDFGDVIADGRSTIRTVTLSNAGDGIGRVTDLRITQSYHDTFGVDWGTCTDWEIPAYSSCAIEVTATPTHFDDFTGDIVIATNDGDFPVHAAATGIARVRSAQFSAGSIDFGPVRIGETVEQRVTVTSTGNDPWSPETWWSSDGADDGFVLGTDDCPAALPAGESCDVVVRFAPTSAGAYGGTWYVGGGASGSTYAGLHVAGYGVDGTETQLLLVQGSLDFGTRQGAGEFPVRTLTVTNTGSAPAQFTTRFDRDSGELQLDASGGDCPVELAVGASCTIEVRVTSTAAGYGSGAFRLVSVVDGHGIGVYESGTGHLAVTTDTQPLGVVLAFSPMALDFGDVPVGEAPVRRITITNTGDAQWWLRGTVRTGLPDIITTDTDCALVDPGETCWIDVLFLADSVGPEDGALGFQGADRRIVASIPVRGNAVVAPPETDPGTPSGTDPTQPTDPADPADPTEPTDPTDPADPADPTEPADPDGDGEPAAPGTPADAPVSPPARLEDVIVSVSPEAPAVTEDQPAADTPSAKEEQDGDAAPVAAHDDDARTATETTDTLSAPSPWSFVALAALVAAVLGLLGWWRRRARR
ncbi:MAG: choice-of-anchor D domain-containing protein [Microbacteriaceae bacterium]|nr:choice-of-anchor D domain-containing protein [Microbacteriaceae bacterium]